MLSVSLFYRMHTVERRMVKTNAMKVLEVKHLVPLFSTTMPIVCSISSVIIRFQKANIKRLKRKIHPCTQKQLKLLKFDLSQNFRVPQFLKLVDKFFL